MSTPDSISPESSLSPDQDPIFDDESACTEAIEPVRAGAPWAVIAVMGVTGTQIFLNGLTRQACILNSGSTSKFRNTSVD
jgi:hypothetical protein